MSDLGQQMNEVIFLLGAGASVDAGIPDTYTFVTDFEANVREHHTELFDLLSKILEVRKAFNKKAYGEEHSQVDIEQLLETLGRLIDKDTDPLLGYYEEKKFSLVNKQSDFIELKKILENYVRARTTIEDESKLEYLNELLSFDTPLEIYSTNYDTCIERLSHIHYKRYTDGFDVYWSSENFDRNFDVKHYKMHGSVTWFESLKTKEYVKIPVQSFIRDEPIKLRLIYGEDVKPLVIYPAQKAEYVEPLTELQLMFKERLLNEKTKFLVAVGYSFRDDYIVHMLWDAARVNANFNLILISPNAQQIFENKLKFINKETNDLSRLYDRVICLSYPFSTVIHQLKNHYLNKLAQILNSFKALQELERSGGKAEWDFLVGLCIDVEFLNKAEKALEKSNKNWRDLDLGTPDKKLLFGFKALLHSVSCNDGHEKIWLNRVNEMLEIFSVENLTIDQKGDSYSFGFKYLNGNFSFAQIMEKWLNPLLAERRKKHELLSPKFLSSLDRLSLSLKKLEAFCEYIGTLAKGVKFINYTVLLESDSSEVKSFIDRIEKARQRGYYDGNAGEPNSILFGVAKSRLKSSLEGDCFRLELT